MILFQKKFLSPFFAYFGIFCIPLIVNPLSFHIYNSAKISWFLFFIGGALSYGILKFFKQKTIEVVSNKKLSFFLFLWILSLFFSTLFSIAPIQSVFGDYLSFQGFLFSLFLCIHFWTCLHLFDSQKHIQLFFNIVLVVACLVTLYALFQYINLNPLSQMDTGERDFRVYGTLGQKNFLGQFLIFPFFIILFGIQKFWRKQKYENLFLYIVLFLLICIVLYLTRNRATWLAILCSGVFSFLIFSPWKKWWKGFFIGISTGIITLFFLFGTIDTRSFHSRGFLWEGVFQTMNWNTLFFGNGVGSFSQSFIKIMPKDVFIYEEFYKTPQNPHNEFLTTFTEQGLLGLIVYLIPLLFLWYLVRKKKIDTSIKKITFLTLITYYISVQFSFSTIEHSVFLAAFFAILLRQTISFKSQFLSVKSIWKRGVTIGTMTLLASFLFFLSYSFTTTDMLLKKGMREYIRTGASAYPLFDKASDLSFFFFYPHKLTLKLFEPFLKENQHLWGPFSTKLEQYGNITNNDVYYHVFAMKRSLLQGKTKEADAHFDQAVLKAPNLPHLYTEAGDMYFEQKDCKNAIKHYTALEALAPSRYHENIRDCKNIKECRIFTKHALSFVEAMRKKEKCEKGFY